MRAAATYRVATVSYGETASSASSTDLGFRSESRKALQNTGLHDFRQCHFVDTPYTRGYTLGFLTGEV